ncbi:16S rRNA (cytidine(1402)-2'-O)-methyltransferase [Nonlabens arenilitoris]|uniref:Ribosomal RNA small subunit methyltransferase I n=1 Tax=Nonlabens arenilitoris TaxID=1217969 RepID=A0A2S7U911_9FLAO|nr:16S rRNA (cytidine(1402)-2'-O)-methyltransferase [Nonlabens arenilitoris]PQJ31425.1 16S rRNA (cytidine(1402)-2'-O)-methyltransferase [Nonlabens arenilitoris]
MKLYLVPTPIGNLADMTYRAVEILKEVDLILAEDTRTSGKLLQHYEIRTPMLSYHMHNEHKIVDHVVSRIKNGEKMALITDAGSPGISDPGFLITRKMLENNLNVEALPGATAFVPALVVSGLPCDKFVFEGFLPVKKGRQKRLEFLKEERRTIIFYESPHKLLKTLSDFKAHYGGDSKVSVSREITKMFEEHYRGTVDDAILHFEVKKPKGEFVVALMID